MGGTEREIEKENAVKEREFQQPERDSEGKKRGMVECENKKEEFISKRKRGGVDE